jgi:hypothetical protein
VRKAVKRNYGVPTAGKKINVYFRVFMNIKGLEVKSSKRINSLRRNVAFDPGPVFSAAAFASSRKGSHIRRVSLKESGSILDVKIIST